MSLHHGSPEGNELLRLAKPDPVTVLHVDDDPDFAELVAVYLEREASSLEVITETDPDSVADHLADIDIDCIVSDYDMPEMNGLELLATVREDYPDLPFILFTGKGSEEIASEAISAGVTDYLQKRGGTDQYTLLANRIRNAVDTYRVEQEIEEGFHAMETAREGISLLDEEGTFLYVNPAYADTYGYAREELIGEHWAMLYPEEHVEQVYEDILPSVPEIGRWQGESIHRTKDGDRLVVDHALAYTDTGTLICLIRDITDAKQTQRTLTAERTRFELFVDAVEEYAIFTLDPDGYVTSWNRGAARIKGYDADEIIGEHFSIFYPDEQAAAGYPDTLLEQTIDEGWITDEGWRLREDGSRFWADVTITAVYDDDGQHRGFVKVTRDRTDQYRADTELDEERRFIDQALDMLEDVFYVLGPDGRITRVTNRAVEVTGYTEQELQSMEPTKLFPDAQRAAVQADIEEAITTGSAKLEADLLTKDGRTIPYEFRKRRLTDEEGTVIGVVGIGRDITERKRRERRLERQLAQFEHFGGVLSHDLRTPLTVAQGRIDLARETGDEEHLDRAEHALDRLDHLIDDLATVMREGNLVNEFTTVELAECVRDVWASLPSEEATLTVDEPVTIRADENALLRLLENLLKNAIEHGGDTITVNVGGVSDGFYIEDDGPGIPADIREEVFDLGYSTKNADEGTGFGLASVQQIAVAHGWEITATDGPAGGARFEITDVELV